MLASQSVKNGTCTVAAICPAAATMRFMAATTRGCAVSCSACDVASYGASRAGKSRAGRSGSGSPKYEAAGGKDDEDDASGGEDGEDVYGKPGDGGGETYAFLPFPCCCTGVEFSRYTASISARASPRMVCSARSTAKVIAEKGQ
jgi:hypothetical protein